MKHASVGMRREIEYIERAKSSGVEERKAAELRLAWMKALYDDLQREPMRLAA